MTHSERQHRLHVIIAFALVYVFWGSTYLGIRYALEAAPPVLMAGARFLIAGPLLLAYFALRGRSIMLTRRDFIRQGLIGLLLLSIANVVLAWAEQWVPTGLAALLVSVTPLWFLVLETWVLPGQHKFGGRALMGLMLGIAGIVILLWPQLSQTGDLGRMQALASIALLGSSCSWATGSVLSKRWRAGADPFVVTGWQMTIAGCVNLLLGLALGQHHHVTASAHGWLAIVYLVIFGSWVGFTAYIWLLKHVPTPKVATYAYVNPVVAVFLGWLFLNERITGYILTGSAIVVASVMLVTGAEVKERKPEEPCDLPEVECTGD